MWRLGESNKGSAHLKYKKESVMEINSGYGD
jgi:hypothetical protein